MKRVSLCMLVALALLVTSAAMAQGGMRGSSPNQPQGASQPGNPGAGPGQQPGYPQQPGADNGTTSGTQNHPEKTEKKLKGCLQSEGGQYVLQTMKGNINLTGQDVSAHVGHEVAVRGMWESGGGSNSPAASNGSSGKSFNVASVDMISDSCKEGKKGDSGSMGTNSPTKGGMSGSSNSGTGSSTGSSTGSQPPQ